MTGFWAVSPIVRGIARRREPARRGSGVLTTPRWLRGRVLPGRWAQDCCGTIEARSNWEGIKSADGDWRAPPRVNNIRRSKALERI